MANLVLERLRAQRADQMAAMDTILENVGDDRDLVDAERQLLNATRERIAELDAQIAPLADYDEMREQHRETVASLPRPEAPAPRPVGRIDHGPTYRSVGAFLVDYVRAHGIMERGVRDDAAAARLYQMRADQTTADTPGILPTPIVGAVVSLLDVNRPLITSLGGAKSLGGIPGVTFSRPKVTQHAQSGIQTAEKTALPSRKMTIGSVAFTKTTRGGTVDISRQDIDWTSPAAWDILVRDLANVYAIDVESTVAADFVVKATGTKPPALPATPVLADWSHALYTAAMHSYSAGQKMPTRIWCSLDVWAALGSLVDTQRVVFPPDRYAGNADPDVMDSWDIGGSSLADFRGDVLGLPRIVVPTAPAKTCIVGPDDLYEVYEEMIGLLSVIEPSILGVQVAYGGYVAFGTLAGGAYVPLDLSAVTSLPTLAEGDVFEVADTDVDTDAPKDEPNNHGRRGGASAGK
jgi:HK97 family phage major capsid protein